MNKPLFSIITPNYNSGVKLRRAAESLEANNASYEHIIIDDFSTDESIYFLSKCTSPTRIFLNRKNVGPGPSRNRGLSEVKGRYILFLDSDDYFVSGALDKLSAMLNSEDFPDVLIFGYQLLRSAKYASNDMTVIDDNIGSIKRLCGDDLVVTYLLDGIVSAPWGKCISSSITKQSEFPDLSVSQDSFFNLDVFIKSKNAILTKDKLYIFDKSEVGSLTSKPFDRKEFKKFYWSWLCFERKVMNDPALKKYQKYMAARKIKFCVLYYINRLALTPANDLDSFVVSVVKAIFIRNIRSGCKYLSAKSIFLALLFICSPKLVLHIVSVRMAVGSK